MKKILIVAYYFSPIQHIASIKPTKLAKYLSMNGFYVDVITSDVKTDKKDVMLERDLKYINKIYPVPYNESNIFGTLGWVKSVKREIKKGIINIKDYDAVITTFGAITVCLIGLYIKKIFRDIVWIAEFRDPMLSNMLPKRKWLRYKIVQEKVIKRADKITAVSAGCLNAITNGKYKNKSFVLTNGYDLDDLPSDGEIKRSDKFTLSYTGTVYSERTKIDPLFKALSELIKEKCVDINDLKFVYAGKDFNYVEEQAKNYNIECILENRGLIQRSDSIKLKCESDYLVVAVWNNKDKAGQGIISGKLLEYMMCGKPIISLVSGNEPNSEIKSMMEAGSLGFCYEEARDSIDYKKLKEYILDGYRKYKNNSAIEFIPNKEFISKYDYRNITKDLIKLMDI